MRIFFFLLFAATSVHAGALDDLISKYHLDREDRVSQEGSEKTSWRAKGEAKYHLQVGSYTNQVEADQKIKQLTDAGFSTNMARAIVGGVTRFRVFVGSFETVKSAKEWLQSTKDAKLLGNPVVTPVQQNRSPAGHK